MLIKNKEIGKKCFIVAEIGINHNGDINIAKQLITLSAIAGADAVKFQKRHLKSCINPKLVDEKRSTPWGEITYMDYKKRLEFSQDEYEQINSHCEQQGILWFASVFDETSLDFIKQFNPPAIKIPSSHLTDDRLIMKSIYEDIPLIVSTGMSTMEEIKNAVNLSPKDLIILHCNSSYPANNAELNLKFIRKLKTIFWRDYIGYSGHETGLATTIAAVALGAVVVERHVTIDRTMYGTDQSASIEPRGFAKLVQDIRTIEKAMGDGVKRIYPSEQKVKERLRWK